MYFMIDYPHNPLRPKCFCSQNVATIFYLPQYNSLTIPELFHIQNEFCLVVYKSSFMKLQYNYKNTVEDMKSSDLLLHL